MGPSTLIAARPHFRKHGSELRFFLSSRAWHSLSPSEETIWAGLSEGPATLESLADTAAVGSLVKAGVAEAIEPVVAPDRRRVLVVEPHSDDAALSIGGTMWKMRNDLEFHLLTMASRSNYTSNFHLDRDYFDRSEITKMRALEGELFTMHLGGAYHCAGMAEATLRYADHDWDRDFFLEHKAPVAMSNNRRADAATLEAWSDTLRDFLKNQSFKEIWIPLGAGNHADHDLARNAALQVLGDADRSTVIRVYEDVPYGREFPDHVGRILNSLIESGAQFSDWSQDVTDEFSKKLSLLTIFASQFKVQSIRAGIEHSAAPNSGPQKVERLWTIERLPTRPPLGRIWIGAPESQKVAARLERFQKNSRLATRVAILAIGAPGGWADDLTRLRKLFPRARFIVYAGPKVRAEFAAVQDPRVTLHSLDGSAASWAKAALREVATSHRILIAGSATVKAKTLALLWPAGRKIIVSEMAHLNAALGS